MNDLALARRVIAGDAEAFEEFFSTYFPRLFRFTLVRVAGNEDAAEEIVQQVLIRSLRRLDTYKGEAALLTWLCTFCRRAISEWRAREGRSREIPLFEDRPEVRALLESVAAGAGDPESLLLHRELSGLVQLTLDHLPGRYGDVLEWKYIEEQPVDEIAKRLGVGYKAAESLLSRARAAFRDAFALAMADWPAGRTVGEP